MDGFKMVTATSDPLTHKLFNYLYKSGLRFGVTGNSAWFSLHNRFVTVYRLSLKSWEVTYLSHTYHFHNQSELIEWIESQRRWDSD